MHILLKIEEMINFICFDKISFLLILLVITKEGFLLRASFKNLLPSCFFPLMAKKISFLLNSLELIDA